MNYGAAMAPIGAEGIVVLPFFNGERIPNLPQGKAGILGGSATNFSKENIARAAMEAAIFGMRIGLGVFQKTWIPSMRDKAYGRRSESALWREIAANVTGLPVHVFQKKKRRP